LSQAAFELVARHIGRSTPDFIFEIDEYRNESGEERLVAHINVLRWSPAVFKRIKREWSLYRQVLTAPLYASPMDDSPRWQRFVTCLGFVPLTTVKCNDGLIRPMYIHKV
jgi:hypothetical protein